MSRLKPGIHHSLTQNIIDLLFSHKIYTVLEFWNADNHTLTNLTKLPFLDIVTIKEDIINANSAVARNGFDYYLELLKHSAIISTGIEKVDTLLEGGLITGNIYEICGPPAVGKSQFCFTLLKNICKNQHNVYYIDTKQDFCATRIKDMLEADPKVGKDEIQQIMTNMLVARLHTKYELINCLHEIRKKHETFKLRVIIIDSLPSLFYQTCPHARNCALMNHFVNVMRYLAREHYVAFLVVNITTTWSEGTFNELGTTTEKIGLGRYWLSIPNTRLMMKQNDLNCEIKIIKSNRLPSGKTCEVTINNWGMS